MNFIWHTFFFDPIYNTLVFFIDSVRGGDVGLAIICTVVLVKILMLPLSLKVVREQIAMREIKPKLDALKETYANNREMVALKTMELFKEARINPFSSIILLCIQIPVLFSLYLSVSSGGGVKLPLINTTLLYPFVHIPETVNTIFLNIVDITAKSMPLALAAGITQFIHTSLSLPPIKPLDPKAEPNFKDDFARSMQIQMKYVLPVIITVAAYSISAAIALYFTVSNLSLIAQEYFMRHKGLKMKV